MHNSMSILWGISIIEVRLSHDAMRLFLELQLAGNLELLHLKSDGAAGIAGLHLFSLLASFQTQPFNVFLLFKWILVLLLVLFILFLVFLLAVYVADLVVESLVLVLFFEIGGVEGHDLIFEFPESEFMLVLFLLGGLYLCVDEFFSLDKKRITYSISLI